MCRSACLSQPWVAVWYWRPSVPASSAQAQERGIRGAIGDKAVAVEGRARGRREDDEAVGAHRGRGEGRALGGRAERRGGSGPVAVSTTRALGRCGRERDLPRRHGFWIGRVRNAVLGLGLAPQGAQFVVQLGEALVRRRRRGRGQEGGGRNGDGWQGACLHRGVQHAQAASDEG